MFLLRKTSIFIALLIVSAFLMFLSAIFGVIVDEFIEARSFFYFGLLILLISLFLTFASFNRAVSSPVRSQILVAITSFIILPVIYTLPLLSVLSNLDVHTLYFEMVSAFTTTGLTGIHTIIGISQTVLFWQALVAWFGGLLIWTFYFSIFNTLDINDIFMSGGKANPDIKIKSFEIKKVHHTEIFLNTFVSICIPFAVITAILWGLMKFSGEDAFIALIYSMSTMATSGISPSGSQIDSINYIGLLAIFIFLLFSLNSNSLHILRKIRFKITDFSNVETNIGMKLIILGATLLSLIKFQDYINFYDILIGVFENLFMCLSFLTTSGWHLNTILEPELAGASLVLAILALIGGGIGTAAGGLKLLRFIVIKRHLHSEFDKMVFPSVIRASESRMRLNDSIILKVWVFFSAFIFFILASMCCLSLLNLPFKEAFFLSMSTFSNTGPLFEVIIQPHSLYEMLNNPIKYVLILAMVLGRIEILILFSLFHIEFWRK